MSRALAQFDADKVYDARQRGERAARELVQAAQDKARYGSPFTAETSAAVDTLRRNLLEEGQTPMSTLAHFDADDVTDIQATIRPARLTLHLDDGNRIVVTAATPDALQGLLLTALDATGTHRPFAPDANGSGRVLAFARPDDR